MALILKEQSTLEECLQKALKETSPIISICKAVFGDSFQSKAKTFLRRIGTKKFENLWKNMTMFEAKNDAPHASDPNTDSLNCQTEPVHHKINDNSKHSHGKFKIEKKLILDEENNLIKAGREWTQNLYSAIPFENVPCLINVQNVNYNFRVLSINCFCKSEICDIKYVLRAEVTDGDHLDFEVTSEGLYLPENHTQRLTRNISGAKRIKIANDVLELGAYKTHNKMVLSTNLTSASLRNEEVVKTMNSLRQMAHQRLAFTDFDSNDITDILCLKEITDLMPSTDQDLTPSYIKFVRCDEFICSWGCKSQLDALMQNKARILSIDATGNVVKNIGGRAFYYSGVFRSELTNEIIPALQFFSCRHDVANITNVLNLFMRELRLFSGLDNPLTLVVIDFSFALMNSVSLSLNNCSLIIYLDLAYMQFIENKPLPIKLTCLASCSVHVIKFFSDQLKVFDRHHKKILLLNFAKSIMCTSYDSFLTCFSTLYIALKYQTTSLDILQTLSNNSGISISHVNIIDSILDDDSDSNPEPDDFSDFLAKSSKYMESKFVIDIESRVRQLREENSSNTLANVFFNNDVAVYLIRRLGPFSILWSSFAHNRETNSIVEAHNKVVKRNILDSLSGKPSRAIKELRVDVLAKLVKVRMDPKYKRFKNLKVVDDPTEGFKKNKPPQLSNFDKIKRLDNWSSSAIGNIYMDVNLDQIVEKTQKFLDDPSNKFFKISVEGVCILKKDFSTLDFQQWVNDVIVCAYLKILASHKPNLLVTDTNFLTKVEACGAYISYPSLKNIDFFEIEYSLIPVFYKPNHWSLILFKKSSLELIFVDSLRKNGLKYLKLVQNFLEVKNEKEKKGYNLENLKLIHDDASPVQQNGCDCGVFLMANCRSFYKHETFSKNSFSESHMEAIRKLMKHEILFGLLQ